MKKIEEYDKDGNEIYCKYPNGDEEWYVYDDRHNEIYIKMLDDEGYTEAWFEYDENNNMIWLRTSYEEEEWRLYDKHNREINTVYADGEQIWTEYGGGNTWHIKSSNGEESWLDTDKDGFTIDITKEEYDKR